MDALISMMSKNSTIGVSLAVVLALSAISLVLMEQRAVAVTVVPPPSVDPCIKLRSDRDAALVALKNDITPTGLSPNFNRDLQAYVNAVFAFAIAGCR
jgi:hypothetical protein